MGQVWRKGQLDPLPRMGDGVPLAICPLAGEFRADPSRMAAAQSSPVSRLHGAKLDMKCCEYSPFPWKKVPFQSQMGPILPLTPQPLQLVGLSLEQAACVTPI